MLSLLLVFIFSLAFPYPQQPTLKFQFGLGQCYMYADHRLVSCQLELLLYLLNKVILVILSFVSAIRISQNLIETLDNIS